MSTEPDSTTRSGQQEVSPQQRLEMEERLLEILEADWLRIDTLLFGLKPPQNDGQPK